MNPNILRIIIENMADQIYHEKEYRNFHAHIKDLMKRIHILTRKLNHEDKKEFEDLLEFLKEKLQEVRQRVKGK